MTKKHTIVAGLDIGTSKVAAVIGEMSDQGVEIIGLGTHPSQGLRKGVVINIENTVGAIKKAVEEAEMMAGCEIHSIFTSVGGSHIKGFNSHGIVAVKNKEVGARDLDRGGGGVLAHGHARLGIVEIHRRVWNVVAVGERQRLRCAVRL